MTLKLNVKVKRENVISLKNLFRPTCFVSVPIAYSHDSDVKGFQSFQSSFWGR